MNDSPASAPQQNPKPQPNRARMDKPSFSVFRALQSVASVGMIVATLFTLWTPANLFSGQIFDSMLFAIEEAEQGKIEITPTDFISRERIGIVSGHWKDSDNAGFVCSDGTTEEQINLRISTLVMQNLNAQGYQVDLLEEFDPRLTQYKALALISIHNDTCEFLGNEATGFKVSPALVNSYPESAERLANCLISAYQNGTGLKYQTNRVTTDMTTYHTFNEVHSTTPVIVIETGYMNLDIQILTQESNRVANAIVDGILCYILEDHAEMEATATP